MSGLRPWAMCSRALPSGMAVTASGLRLELGIKEGVYIFGPAALGYGLRPGHCLAARHWLRQGCGWSRGLKKRIFYFMKITLTLTFSVMSSGGSMVCENCNSFEESRHLSWVREYRAFEK